MAIIVRLLAVSRPGAQNAQDNHLLACNFANYSPTKNFYSLTDLPTNLFNLVINNPIAL